MQNVGRLCVVIAMLNVPLVVRSVRADQSASSSVTSRSAAAMSNQYQPPSTNCLSGSVTRTSSTELPVTTMESTGWLFPLAVDWYTITEQAPLTLTRRTTSRTVVQRLQ